MVLYLPKRSVQSLEPQEIRTEKLCVHGADVIQEHKAASCHRVVAGEQKSDGEPSHPPRGSAIMVTLSTGNAPALCQCCWIRVSK